MRKFIKHLLLICATTILVTSCLCSNSTSTYDDDPEYWSSVNRERQLKNAGLDDAAKMERNARRDYMKGGGYTSPDGSKQVHYNGSKQQQADLDAIDKYMSEHPEF